jgi:glycine cleavage system H protein
LAAGDGPDASAPNAIMSAPFRFSPHLLEPPMPSPANCRFSESHEWFRLDGGNVVTLGITQFAANELTDITYVEMKPVGTKLQAGGPVGEVESVKTSSDIYSAVGGTISEVNADAAKDPSLLNSDPFDKGWLVKIKTDDPAPLNKLMDQKTYDQKHPVG